MKKEIKPIKLTWAMCELCEGNFSLSRPNQGVLGNGAILYISKQKKDIQNNTDCISSYLDGNNNKIYNIFFFYLLPIVSLD